MNRTQSVESAQQWRGATYFDGRPLIEVSMDETRTADQAIEVLALQQRLYARLGKLVRVAPSDRVSNPGYLQIVEPAAVRELLTEAAAFGYFNEKSEIVRLRCPQWLIPAIRSRASWPGIHAINGVVHSPVWRPDGTLHQTEGFDAATGCYYQPLCELPAVPERVSLDEAHAASERLVSLVDEFPWALPSDLTGFLAALLTPQCQYAFQGPAPMFLFDKNAPGAGSSQLCDVIGLVNNGFTMDRTPLPVDEGELIKTITGYVLEGDRICLIDNLRGKVGGSVIELALTAERWRARVLGGNSNVRGALSMLWYATANNVSLTPDVARRTLQIRLEVEHERPDERTFRIRDLLGHVRRTRAELLHAASLVLAGWFSAGAPRPQHLAPWGSFDGWNGMVHAALVWAGYAPLDGNRRRLRDDADVDTHALQDALLELDRSLRQWGLSSASGRAALTVRDMLERIQRAPDATKSLRYALEALSATPPGQPLSAKRVGAAFGTFRNKIVNGLRLVRDAQRGEDGYRWTVERVSADGASAPPAALAAPAPPAPEPEPELWTPDDDPTL